MKCLNCGCENPDGSVICEVCGSSLQSEKGANITDTTKTKNRIKTIKKISIVALIILVVSIVSYFLITSMIIPANKYNQAIEFENNGDYISAISLFIELEDYRDSYEHINALTPNVYEQAVAYEKDKDFLKAISAYSKVNSYEDSFERMRELVNRNTGLISAGRNHTVGLKSDGTVEATINMDDIFNQYNVSDWKDVVAISAGTDFTIGLKSDGTVVADGGKNDDGQCNISNWKDIVAISAGYYHTVGLKSDGTVVAVGNNYNGQCNVLDWKDIVAISAGEYHTVGLKSDGTVVAVGDNLSKQCEVSKWKDIVAISAGYYHTVGLKSDGTVVAVGTNTYGKCDVSDWTDIVAVSAGEHHTVGLKSDGTVVEAGQIEIYLEDIPDWTDIVAISVGYHYTVGLKSDGTVVFAGSSNNGQYEVYWWNNIKTPYLSDISATESATIVTTEKPQLSDSYTILATGTEDNGDVYELVGEQNETVNNGGVKIGVIKNNEWLVEMTSDIPFVSEDGYVLIKDVYSGKEIHNLDRDSINCGVFFEYCGNGVFIDYYFYAPPMGIWDYYYTYGVAYNSENKKSCVINCAVTCPLGLKYCTEDNATMRYWDDSFKLRDKLVYNGTRDSKLTVLNLNTMETKQIDGITNFCQYSEGLIFVRSKNPENFCGFLDENLNVAIDLTDYDLKLQNSNDWRNEWRENYNYYIFNDGKCEFTTKSKTGSKFKVTIDKTGKVLSSVEVG